MEDLFGSGDTRVPYICIYILHIYQAPRSADATNMKGYAGPENPSYAAAASSEPVCPMWALKFPLYTKNPVSNK